MIYKKCKIILIGNGGCGKTSYIAKLLTRKLIKKYNPTIGVNVDFLYLPNLKKYVLTLISNRIEFTIFKKIEM